MRSCLESIYIFKLIFLELCYEEELFGRRSWLKLSSGRLLESSLCFNLGLPRDLVGILINTKTAFTPYHLPYTPNLLGGG